MQKSNGVMFSLLAAALMCAGLRIDAQQPAPVAQQSAPGGQQPAPGGQQPAPGGQQPAPAQKVDKAHATEIVLPVTVRDKHGDLVPNVQKGDLTVLQDGRPQNISSLTQNSTAPLRVGLLLDTGPAMKGIVAAEGASAGHFVDMVLPASGESPNLVFLIHFDRQVELLRDFTSSREKLHSELDDLGSTHSQRYDVQDTADEDRTSRPGHNGTQLYDAIYLASDELMKSKDGRKVLIVFSDGADLGSKETLNDAVDAADRANVAVYTIFFKGEQVRDLASELPGSRRRPGMGGGWPGSGGSYPGSAPRGGEPRSANGMDGKKIMEQIARRTGGHAYEARKKDDLDPIYKLIDDELHGQYTLTYTPDKSDSDDSFHKVEITASNKEWSVATREGFYPPDASER